MTQTSLSAFLWSGADLLRDVAKVSFEWKLICLTGNLPKLFRSDWSPQTA